MLGDNIKTFRMSKGFTQEQLAVRLNVVRQTVSKWEKNLSVPDAETLTKLSELLEISVSDLLGTPQKEEKEELSDIAQQLQNLNEMLTIQAEHQKSIAKKIRIAVAVIILILVVGAIYPKWNEMWYELGQNLYYHING